VDAPASISMGYEQLIDVVDGRLPPHEFVASHIQPTRGSQEQVAGFLALMGRAFEAAG